MNLYEAKRRVVKLIDDFDSNNNLTTDDDIKNKLNDFFNSAIIEASQHKKLEKKQVIVQNIPMNEVPQKLYSTDIFTHTNKDVEIKAVGQCYTFYVNETATVYIYLNNELIRTINHKGTQEFERYFGIVPNGGEIRIVFSGEYYYSYRNIAIFNVKYTSEDKIPDWKRYINYPLNKDFYELNSVMINGNRANTEDYKELKEYDVKVKQILLNGYSIGEFEIYYNAYSKQIPEEISDLEEKNFIFDLEEDIADAMCFSVAYMLTLTDPSFNSSGFYTLYLNKIELIRQNQNQPMITITNLFNSDL